MLCRLKGVDLLRSDVGDKYISRMLVEENLLVGAESSGHIIKETSQKVATPILHFYNLYLL